MRHGARRPSPSLATHADPTTHVLPHHTARPTAPFVA